MAGTRPAVVISKKVGANWATTSWVRLLFQRSTSSFSFIIFSFQVCISRKNSTSPKNLLAFERAVPTDVRAALTLVSKGLGIENKEPCLWIQITSLFKG
jgi:hypothetical protein